MWTIRCALAFFVLASCGSEKEAKPIEVKAPEVTTPSPAPSAEEVAQPTAKPTEVPAEGEAATESTYTVSFSAAGKDLLPNVRVLRKVSGLTVGEVRALIDGVPSDVKAGLSRADAEAMVKELSEVGFTAEMKATGVAAKSAGTEADKTYSVTLTSFGDKKIHVIKIVRKYTGLGLKDTKELVESAPVEVKAGLSKADADAMLAELKAVSALAEIK
jgi:large subunit ribosomal protein L7/L12